MKLYSMSFEIYPSITSLFVGMTRYHRLKTKKNFSRSFISHRNTIKRVGGKAPPKCSILSDVSKNEVLGMLSNPKTDDICNKVRVDKYFAIQCVNLTSH